MDYKVSTFAVCLVVQSAASIAAETTTTELAAAASPPQSGAPEQITVWSRQPTGTQSGLTSPISSLSPEDLKSINLTTTEDAVKYEPSVIIRRRFIGDSNGTLGMRGSNMFQTPRSMVFADGVPLHYFLETRWSGAPRWTMVSASEIANIDVVYGPFSAEYSGNAMGGVVLIETAIPQTREFHIDGTWYNQQFDAYGFDDAVDGFKGFVSYGDRIGDASVYFSYNRLQGESQPQSFYYGRNSSSTGTAVSGAIQANDKNGAPQWVFGDSGVVDTTTNNYKIKVGYHFDQWSALLNIAYEDRLSETESANSYIRDLQTGELLWEGTVTQGDDSFSIGAKNLAESALNRDSLNLGLRAKGELSRNVRWEADLSRFSVLKDETRSAKVNRLAPSYDGSGQIKDYDDTGWYTGKVKFQVDELGREGLSLTGGLSHEAYELNIDGYNTANHLVGSKDEQTSSNGGKTRLSAAFAQLSWAFMPAWDAVVGGRYERWASEDGYYDQDVADTPELDLASVPDRTERRFSPKFALGYQPLPDWSVRYSVAKAYRFPIVEELYNQFESFTAKSIANPELEPENGLHHNLMIENRLGQGYVRVNFFRENVKDVIESQTETVVGPTGNVSVRTFIPVDEVETTGVEVIVNQHDALIDGLNVRLNLAYTDSEIERNDANPDFEGKQYPRMPYWRGNALVNYRVSPAWSVAGNVQYASNSYGSLDNSDTESNVYGAQDGYTRFGAKATWAANQNTQVHVGVDNITDEIAYVAHPWPGRTFYLSASYDL